MHALERPPLICSLKKKHLPVLTPPSLNTSHPGKPFGHCCSRISCPQPSAVFTPEDKLQGSIVYAAVLAHQQAISAFFVIEYTSRKTQISLSQFLNLPLYLLFLALGFPLHVSPPLSSTLLSSLLCHSKVPIYYKKSENTRKIGCLFKLFRLAIESKALNREALHFKCCPKV